MSTAYPQPEVMQGLVRKFDLRNASLVSVGDLVLTSGIGAFDLETGEPVEGDDIRVHAGHALDTYERVLGEFGLGLGHVVKVSAFLRFPEEDYPGWNEVYHDRFQAPYPCRTTVGGALVSGRIELDLTASWAPRTAWEG